MSRKTAQCPFSGWIVATTPIDLSTEPSELDMRCLQGDTQRSLRLIPESDTRAGDGASVQDLPDQDSPISAAIALLQQKST
jgi:hypothetical protein